jgi:hypothetical protein
MNEKKLAGWAASSENPEQISNRIKGIVLSLSSVLIFMAAQFLGLTLNANDISDLASLAGVTAGAIWTLYGVFLALVNKFARK